MAYQPAANSAALVEEDPVSLAELSSGDAGTSREVEMGRAGTRRTWAAGTVLVAGCLLLTAIATPYASPHPQAASPQAAMEATQIIAKPGRKHCSSYKENCMSTGCCNVVGLTCFTTVPGMAKCMKNCLPSKTQECKQPQQVMNPILEDANPPPSPKLYCFTLVAQITGSTKKSFDVELTAQAHSLMVSIFACDLVDVFSDAAGEVAPGWPYTVISDVKKDFYFAKRKHQGTWINTGKFVQIWKSIAAAKKYQEASWVAKVDPGTVFLPSRLRTKLASQMVPPAGIYLENCKYVEYGYFGNLEIFSLAAFETLLAQMDTCYSSPEIDWKVGVHHGKSGPMGEDLFAQTCLDMASVRRVEAFDYTISGTCPADRPRDEKKNTKWKPNCAWYDKAAFHKFAKPAEWKSCYEKTVGAYGM